MKLIADLHTHTIASTHAYSTLQEMVAAETAGGMLAMAVTDHAPAVPDAPHPWYFQNLLRLPNWLPDGFLLLRGVEVNVLEPDGALDLEQDLLQKLDWNIASMHRSCIKPKTVEEATAIWLKIAENPCVDMIGHSEQQQYLYDYDRVTKAFSQNGKVVELNANSAETRPGNEENQRRLALSCKRNNTLVAVNSDAHSVYGLHNQQPILDMLADICFPEKLVVNASFTRLLDVLRRHGKQIPPQNTER